MMRFALGPHMALYDPPYNVGWESPMSTWLLLTFMCVTTQPVNMELVENYVVNFNFVEANFEKYIKHPILRFQTTHPR